MPTIRELAAAAEVSVSTVSIVLRGEAKQRKISQATQTRVWEAARRLGYQPNVSARRLRSRTAVGPTVAVFWGSDFRAPLMVRFLRGLQEAILKTGKQVEILIHPYQVGALPDALDALSVCNAAIVCNASEYDIAFLETMTLPVPVVLYNRISDKLCGVMVDNAGMGATPARVFASHGYRQAVLLTGESSFPGMDVRERAFVDEALRQGMAVRRMVVAHSMAGGFAGGGLIEAMTPRPDCVFCISDMLAIGLLRYLGKAAIRVPEDMALISIGNGDQDMEEYASTALSVVHLPMERMAAACLGQALGLMDGTLQAPLTETIPFSYQPRESCGPMAT